MFQYGSLSKTRLSTATNGLQRVFEEALKRQVMDIAILQGHRGEVEQNAAFASGASKLRWPQSKHNSSPSMAVDAAPYPIRWGDKGDPQRVKAIGRFYMLAGLVLGVAAELGVKVRWGGDWDQDGDIFDQDFDDLVHFEEIV
jgi:peptidoglycan L-alanyl-D-glutamate endopeptidase CwlK